MVLFKNEKKKSTVTLRLHLFSFLLDPCLCVISCDIDLTNWAQVYDNSDTNMPTTLLLTVIPKENSNQLCFMLYTVALEAD